MKRQKSLRQLAKELEISPAYLSMILSGQRKCPPELADKLPSIPGVHKVVNSSLWEVPSKQRVERSNRSRDAIPQSERNRQVVTKRDSKK